MPRANLLTRVKKKAHHSFPHIPALLGLLGISLLLVFLRWTGGVILGSVPVTIPSGETAQIAPFMYQLSSAQSMLSLGEDPIKVDAEGRFIVISLLARNNSDQPAAINQSLISLSDDAGNTVLPVCRDDIAPCPPAFPHTFLVRDLRPKEASRGVFVFDVIGALSDYRLKIQGKGPPTFFELK